MGCGGGAKQIIKTRLSEISSKGLRVNVAGANWVVECLDWKRSSLLQ